MKKSHIALSVCTGLALSTFASASQDATLELRLEKLALTLEAAREEAHIPGMSIAIVKDDELVWARGFGLADVASGRPADESTIYAIGSTTKAFTATLVGMLADEGKVNWDEPVTTYLPYFDLDLQSDDEGAECTLRDLLSHRHGFMRMAILFLNPGVSREEVLRTATGAEPWDDFRAGFHYSNVAYLACGEAAGAAAGSSWERLMMERIIEPLHMTSTTLSAPAAQGDPRLALGYFWNEADEQFEKREMIDLQVIAAAGAVNSNVLDLAQWLRLQLGRGQVDGTRLISAERILETWEAQIEMGDGASYGLGWMLREHDGRRVVEHGGNVDGFSAQIGMMPEENLGYVLLANLDVSPLRHASLGLVFDALLNDWPEDAGDGGAAGEVAEIDLEGYVGTYIANFATFRDEEFEVAADDHGLTLDIPSQQTFELERPNEEGKWGFVLTDTVAVSFQHDERGEVAGLTVHQGGFAFQVPRKGVVLEPDVPPQELEKYVGTYVRAEGGKRIKISIEHGRLNMLDKGNLLDFETPDADGHAPLRARADHGATFMTGAAGGIDSFVFHGSAGDKLFTRLADLADDVPTLEALLEMRATDTRVAALRAAGGTKATGRVWIPQAGVHGKVTLYSRGSDRYANHLDFGKFGRVDAVASGQGLGPTTRCAASRRWRVTS